MFLTITTANVDAGIGGNPIVVRGPNEVDWERTFAIGHRVQCQNVEFGREQQGQGQRSGSQHHYEPSRRHTGKSSSKSHGQIIEEGNVSVCVSSLDPRAESVLFYEGNNEDDPPIVHLEDASKSIIKWPMEALQAIPPELQQTI